MKNAKVHLLLPRRRFIFLRKTATEKNGRCRRRKKSEDVSVESLISFLKEIDTVLSPSLSGITFPNRNLIVLTNIEEKYYENSDGSKLESRVPRVEYLGLLTALYNGKPRTISLPPGYPGLGGTGGWEIIENLHLVESLPKELKN